MIKCLAGSIREYKFTSIITPVLISCEVLIECLIPLIMANLIDYGIEPGDMQVVIRLGITLVVMSIVSLGFGGSAGYTCAYASAGFAKNLRHDLFYKVQNFSFTNIDRFSTSSLITRLTTDVTNVQMAYMFIIRIAVRSPVMLVFSLIMAIKINPRMSLIFLVALPILAIGLYIITVNAHPIFEKVFQTYDKLNNDVQENLRGVRVVKSFVREDFEKQKFAGVSEAIFKLFTKAERILAFNSPLMLMVIFTCMTLIFWFGANIIVKSGATELTTGQLTGLITYTMQMLMSLMMLTVVFVMIIISRASAKRICEVLTEEIDLKDNDDPIFEVPDGSISFENVNFSYLRGSSTRCLYDVNLEIKSGQTVGIIGGTGSSKSSLVQLIPRLYDPLSGVVKVGGIDVQKYDVTALRNEVAMVLQKNTLFSGTIKENLRWGNDHATDEELEEACKLAQAHDFITSFPDGYDTYIEQGGTNVSGGQKQRICIARALLKKPKILILDDSTSAVDTRTDALIRKAFREYIPETTKLIIAQRISSIEDADIIIVMDAGRIDAVGTHEELLAGNKIYREVYESQKKGVAVDEN